MINSLILPEKSKRRRKFFLSKAKLSHIVSLSSFFAGFAIRSVANLQINENPDKTFLLMYVIITTLLVACTCFVILVSLWVLPLLVTADVINDEIERLLKRQKKRMNSQRNNGNSIENLNPYPVKSPLKPTQSWLSNGLKTFEIHRSTVRLTEIAWLSAGTISVFLFIFDVIIVIWIKFQHFTQLGVIIATTILTAIIVGLGMFGIYFRLFVVHKFERLGRTRENSVNPVGQIQHLQVPQKRNSYGSMDQGPSQSNPSIYSKRSSFEGTSRSSSIAVV